MEFQFATAYNQEAVTALAKTLRKTARKKRSRRSHIFGVLVMILAILLTLPLGDKVFVLDFKTVITWLAAAMIFFALIFEDRLNGYIARKRMLPGLAKATTTFKTEGYYSETEIGASEFKYSTIVALAETERYFVFVFGQNHAQVYDKQSIIGGTMEDFRDFITTATGKNIEIV